MTSPRGALAVALALLVAIAALPPLWHLPAGLIAWAMLRWLVHDVHRTMGRPRRWLQALVALCVLGALFGETNTELWSFPLSTDGALSGSTMVVRAFALVGLASVASAVLPLRRWAERIRHPAVRRLIEVVIIAANLVPVQLRALSTASATLRERRPGLRRLPARLWLLAVHCSVQAAMLAENVAFDMAITAHNASSPKKST